jgi:hypothetical protein
VQRYYIVLRFLFELKHPAVLSCDYYVNEQSAQLSIHRLMQHASTPDDDDLLKAKHATLHDIQGVPGGMCQTSGGCSLC